MKAVLQMGISTNEKHFRYVKSKLKSRVRITTLKYANGSLSVSPSDKAETLNCYFSSVFGE